MTSELYGLGKSCLVGCGYSTKVSNFFVLRQNSDTKRLVVVSVCRHGNLQKTEILCSTGGLSDSWASHNAKATCSVQNKCCTCIIVQ